MTSNLDRYKSWLVRAGLLIAAGVLVGGFAGGLLGAFQRDPSTALDTTAYASRMDTLTQRTTLARGLVGALSEGRYNDFGRLLGYADWNALQEGVAPRKGGSASKPLEVPAHIALAPVERIERIQAAAASKQFAALAQLLGYRSWDGVQSKFLQQMDPALSSLGSEHFSSREAESVALSLSSLTEEALSHAAHMDVIAEGCKGCGTRTVEWGTIGAALGACGLGALPAAIGGWFLFLYMLGEIAASVRGDRR